MQTFLKDHRVIAEMSIVHLAFLFFAAVLVSSLAQSVVGGIRPQRVSLALLPIVSYTQRIHHFK